MDDSHLRIFDECLNNGNNTNLLGLINTIGHNELSFLVHKSDYARKDDILKQIMKELIKSIPKPKVEYMFGCRHPKSKYAWDKAFVVAKKKGATEITLAMFENGADFIGHTRSYKDAFDRYQKYVKDGWLPMDKDDLIKTVGEVDDDTILEPIKTTDSIWFKYTFLFVASIIAFLVGSLVVTPWQLKNDTPL